MKHVAAVFVVGTVLVACGASRPLVAQSDIDAWRGAPLMELETHPRFGGMPHDVRRLSDESGLWVYTNCMTGNENIVCSSAFNTTQCSGGGRWETCCQRSFHIVYSKVDWMQLSGSCRTRCTDRPASKPCTPDEQKADRD